MRCSVRKAIRAMFGSPSVGGPFSMLPQPRSLVVLRPLIGCLALCVVAAATRAAVVRIESDDEVLTTFQMSVTPAAEPTAALHYRLLPPELERQPGNGAPFYYRTLLQYMSVAKQLEKDHGADYLDWRSLPIDQLPLPGLRDVVKSFDSAVLDQLREATRRKACDWDFQETSWTGPKQFQFVLPELQSTRGVARILALRVRLAIAEGRFDDAIESLQLGYQMADAVLSRLVGHALRAIA